MRRDDDLREPEQRARVRLGLEDVERRACDLPRPDRLVERCLVDEPAARGVDDADAVLHLRERLGVDEAAGLVAERKVQRDDVGLRVDVRRGRGRLDAELAEAVDGDERVVGDDAHAEPERHDARLAVPIRPSPRTPSVLPASSIPVKRSRSQAPAVSAACACGTFRASARRSAIACSAAESTVDSAAFATTMPRRVAASTSTLSTPTPARPITFSRPARSISAASTVVAERTTSASKSPMISASSDSPSSTTSNRLFRSSSPSRRWARGRGRAVAQTRAASWYASSARAVATPGSIAAPRSTRSASTAVSAVVMSSTS